jgi:hypothetical protein
MIEVLLALAVVGAIAATLHGAAGPYLVASWAVRLLVALGDAPGLGLPILVVTAIVDGSLLWSFFYSALVEGPQLQDLGDRVRVREQAEHSARVDECDGRAEPIPVLL